MRGDLMGMFIGSRNISLDVKDKSSDINFVSHAHSDHTSGVSATKETLSSDVTSELVAVRKGIKIKSLRSIEGARLLNAGHVLGSKQLYGVSDGGYSFVYSGDYQLQESLVAERIEITNADVLIIDSTYPYKDLEFEDKNDVITAIQHYLDMKIMKGTILFGAYALGKAQELIKIANEAGYTPLVSRKICAVNEVYNIHGAGLKYISESEGAEFTSEPSDTFIGIVEMNRFAETNALLSKSGKKVFTAVATGFANMFHMNTDVQFGLSDHADFGQATEYIDQCSPKVIYTYGNRRNQKEFAEALSSEGYNAHPYYESDYSIATEANALAAGPNMNAHKR